MWGKLSTRIPLKNLLSKRITLKNIFQLVAQPLAYRVEYLSEGTEGFSEMIKELRSLVKEKWQRRSMRNTRNGVKIDQ